ncbi:MAG TPA: phage integrase SAM-like domain-containing protein, partial [Chitinophagales bacterium]|nr:phage integrase SAM-like domain-containing protein [Chitinophagales bacterium]
MKKFRKGRVDSNVANASLINSTLTSFQLKAQKLYDQFEETKKFPQSDLFKKRLLQDTITFTEERDFVKDFGVFIEYLENKGASVSTVKNMKVGLMHLKAMSEQEGCALDYSNIDLNFYGKLKKYFLVTKKSKINTFGRGVKTLKTFLNYAKSLGWNKYDYYKHTEFKILTEESDIVALTEDEVLALNGLDLAKRPRLALTRDYFVLACETSPRYSDYAKLNRDSIKEVEGGYNLDLVKTQKTGVRVVIPLSQLAFSILQRNGFNLELPPTNQKFNENLKE